MGVCVGSFISKGAVYSVHLFIVYRGVLQNFLLKAEL